MDKQKVLSRQYRRLERDLYLLSRCGKNQLLNKERIELRILNIKERISRLEKDI